MISTPSPSAIAVVPLAVPPSIKFNSAGVAVIWSVEAAANGCNVPATLAMLTALSAVGSTTPNVVSKLSALAPSNTTEPLNTAPVAVIVLDDVIAPEPTVPANVTFAPLNVAAVVVPDFIIKLPELLVALP